MARVVIGICPHCGATLKIHEYAARPSVRYTCACGWTAAIAVDDALVARGEKLRSERLAVKHHRLAEKQTQQLKIVAGLLAVAGAIALLLALLLPRLSSPTTNTQPVRLLLFLLCMGCAVGVALSVAALHDVARAKARGRRTKKRH